MSARTADSEKRFALSQQTANLIIGNARVTLILVMITLKCAKVERKNPFSYDLKAETRMMRYTAGDFNARSDKKLLPYANSPNCDLPTCP